MSPKSKVRESTLPEGMNAPEVDLDAMVKAFEKKERERSQDRVKRFREKLSDNKSVDRQVLIKKILIAKLKAEKNGLNDTIKQLRGEIKGIRQDNKEMRQQARADKQAAG